MIDKKKMWQRPEMTVLVRSNPEEAVLSVCKVIGKAPTDGPNIQQGCGFQTGAGIWCSQNFAT